MSAIHDLAAYLVSNGPTLLRENGRFYIDGRKQDALEAAANEIESDAPSIEYLMLAMAYGYASIDLKEEAVKWFDKLLCQGLWYYRLYKRIDFCHNLQDHAGLQAIMNEMKRRPEAFGI